MKITPPVELSNSQLTFDASEIEPLLQAPPMNLPPWPEAQIHSKTAASCIFARPNSKKCLLC